MTAERLAELEAWARAWSRCETVGARNVLELVDEVRRLRMVAAARAPRVYTEDGGIVIPEELMPGYYSLTGKQPAPLPPTTDAHREAFRGFMARRNPNPAGPAELERDHLQAYCVVRAEGGSVLWQMRSESPEPIPDARGTLERIVAMRASGNSEWRALAPNGCSVTGSWCPAPAPVPPFRGILDGDTAADVYGVQA